MSERETVVSNGEELKKAVDALGKRLGLISATEVRAGRRIWGARRHIDVVFTHPQSRISLGIECKYRIGSGSTERIHAIEEDIKAWPIKGIIVTSSSIHSDTFHLFLKSTGFLVEYEDLEDWAKLFFGL